MSKRGRPIFLDEAKKGRILGVLAMGGTRRAAARFVGCSTVTIRNQEKRDPPFAEAVKRCTDASELAYLGNVRTAAKDVRHWRAAAWALERTRPQRFARRSPDVLTMGQFGRFANQVAAIVGKEVPARFRKGVLRQLDQLLGAVRPAGASEDD